MRLIDADTLINDIEEIITEHEEMMRDSEEHPENYPKDYKTRVLNLIAGLITTKVEVDCAPTIDAEPVKHGGWIPCSERLPEHRFYVLVTYKYEYGLTDNGITWYSETENKWNTSREVIAWMPLPKPYGEDSEVE